MMKYINTEQAFNDLPENIHYYLMCASYEDRSLSLLDYQVTNNIKNFNIFYFKEFEKFTRENIEKYRSKFNDIKEFEVSLTYPLTISNALVNCFNNLEKGSNVVIDISTFTREGILILLKYFEIHKTDFSEIYIFYRAALTNSIDELSSMVVQIRSVLGYMGEFKENLPSHLIILSGFEINRAKEMIDTIEPDYISISHGYDYICNEMHIANCKLTQDLISYYENSKVDQFQHSLKDIEKTKRAILNITMPLIEKRNFIVATLSNKISTIGAGLAAIECPSIQICYSQVENYNTECYSKKLDECYIIKLNI